MSPRTLRAKLVRLAYAEPELRSDLLRLLRTAQVRDPVRDIQQKLGEGYSIVFVFRAGRQMINSMNGGFGKSNPQTIKRLLSRDVLGWGWGGHSGKGPWSGVLWSQSGNGVQLPSNFHTVNDCEAAIRSKVHAKVGGAYGSRTRHLFVANEVLYQIS